MCVIVCTLVSPPHTVWSFFRTQLGNAVPGPNRDQLEYWSRSRDPDPDGSNRVSWNPGTSRGKSRKPKILKKRYVQIENMHTIMLVKHTNNVQFALCRWMPLANFNLICVAHITFALLHFASGSAFSSVGRKCRYCKEPIVSNAILEICSSSPLWPRQTYS